MRNEHPQHFDEAFLHWFQEQTEETWRTYRMRTFEEFVASYVSGSDWQQGTHWLGGLSDQEITAIEQHFHVHFPPDYPLFLRVLHSVDRPRVGAGYVTSKTMMVPRITPSFYNWQTDLDSLQRAYEWLVEGLFFDVRENTFWLQSWGVQPTILEAQEERVRELVHAAPKLIPVFGHRYLLVEPCTAGNPIFSIHQSDITVDSDTLHDYFLKEFRSLVGAEKAVVDQKTTAERWEAYLAIPFWGEFLS